MDSRVDIGDSWQDRNLQKEVRRRRIDIQSGDTIEDYFRCPECRRFLNPEDESPDGPCFDCTDED